MARRVACISAFVLFALVPVAAADGGGPNPGLMQGWTGVTGPGQPFRYVTLSTGTDTFLEAVRRSTGRVINWRPLQGTWGVPIVANDGTTGGLSRDGRLLVLADWNPPRNSALRATSRFLLVSTKTFRLWRRVSLRGDFAFDALSPGGGTLFLIEHVSSKDLTRYRVRAYDIAAQRLLPRVIADRRQASWVMQGYPVTRATSADGRSVYTLYQQQGGYPFVHALDAVNRTAVCVGIPWRGNQQALGTARLRLDSKAGKLAIETRQGRALFTIDTGTFWVSRPVVHEAGFPFALVLGPAAGGLAFLLFGLAFRRRIRLTVARLPNPLLR
jgi:hypothetical protein